MSFPQSFFLFVFVYSILCIHFHNLCIQIFFQMFTCILSTCRRLRLKFVYESHSCHYSCHFVPGLFISQPNLSSYPLFLLSIGHFITAPTFNWFYIIGWFWTVCFSLCSCTPPCLLPYWFHAHRHVRSSHISQGGGQNTISDGYRRRGFQCGGSTYHLASIFLSQCVERANGWRTGLFCR